MQNTEPTLFTQKPGLSKVQLTVIAMVATLLFGIALHLLITPAPLTEDQQAWLRKLDIELQIKQNSAEYDETAKEMNAKLQGLVDENTQLRVESAQIEADLLGL